MKEHSSGSKDAPRELLIGRLVDLAAQLEALATFSESGMVPTFDSPSAQAYELREILATPRAQTVVRHWRSIFREDLDFVRRARNSVVHGMDIGDEELDSAVEIAQRLRDLVMEPLE